MAIAIGGALVCKRAAPPWARCAAPIPAARGWVDISTLTIRDWLSEGARSNYWLLVACTALVALPYIVVLVRNDYLPGPDEAFQLQAAVRLFDGQGYTVTPIPRLPADIGSPRSVYLLRWPLGYSLVIAALMKTGLSVLGAAKIIKLTVVLASIGLWAMVGHRYLDRASTRLVFGAFIGFFVAPCAGSAADLIVFTLFGALTLALLSYGQFVIGTPSDASARRLLLASGLIAGCTSAVKYSALPFVVLPIVWITWVNRRDLARGARDAAWFHLPAMVLVLSVFITNRLNGGRAIALSGAEAGDTVHGWPPEFIVASMYGFLIDGPYLPRVALTFAAQEFGSGLSDALSTVLLPVMVTVFGGCVLVLSTRGRRERQLLAWLAVAYVCNGAFLAATTSLYIRPSSPGEWTPLVEGRYYQWLVPIALIIALTAATPPVQIRRAWLRYAGSVAASAAVVLFAGVAYEYARYVDRVTSSFTTSTLASYATLRSLAASERAQAMVVIADSYNHRAFIWRRDVITYPGTAVVDTGAYVSRRALVALVCSRFDVRESVRGLDHCATEGFDVRALTLGLNRASGSSNTIYWRVVPAGSTVLR